MRYHRPCNSAVATCVLLVVAVGYYVLQGAEAAASPDRRHGKRVRPDQSMMTVADQPNADNGKTTDYDDTTYDEGADDDEENNDYHKGPPPAAAADRRTIH